MLPEQTFSILAVDDNPINLRIIEKVLSKEGYRIITASNGLSALKLARREQPHLILLDIMMPGENGFEVLKKLRNNAGTTSIPVIFLTSVSEIDSKLAGFELGAVDYIIKPFHPLEVLARIRLHLKLSIATNSLIAAQARKLRQLAEAQTSMLTSPDDIPDARFGVSYLALHEAGGDFYEVMAISESIHAYFVADFSGHDISTSFLTASLKALLQQNCTPIYKPQESIKLINDVLVEILPSGKYLTSCYARLNRTKMELSIINSAHPPACFVPAKGEPRLVNLKGDILGIFHDVIFETVTFPVAPGDRFYLYSDGLLESGSSKKVWTEGKEALLKACQDARDVPIREAPERIKEHLLHGKAPLEDDLVLLGVEI